MKKIVGMFPGQGSQYVGMADEWYKKYDVVKKMFDTASEIIGVDLPKLCFQGGDLKELTKTEIAQPAILTCSLAMFELLKQDYNFHYLIGHSLGEISALTAAGAIAFEDAVSLVRLRGEKMRDCALNVKTGMTAIGNISVDRIQKVIDSMYFSEKGVCIANYNSSNQIIISGSLEDLEKVEKNLEQKGARVTKLNVSGAFHSRYMEGAIEPLREKLTQIEIKTPEIPVVSGFTCELYKAEDNIRDMLANQVIQQVKFAPLVKVLNKKNIGLWLEIGPGEVLKKLVRRNIETAETYSYDKDAEIIQEKYETVLEKNKLEPSIFALCMGQAVATRNRNVNEEGYEEGVIKRYQTLQRLNEEWKGKKISAEAELDALRILKGIMDTKYVPEQEQKIRFSNLCDELGRFDLWKGIFE